MTVFSNFGKYGIVGVGGGGLAYSYLATAFASTTNASLSGSNRIATLGSAGSVAHSNTFTLAGFQYLEMKVTTNARYWIASFSKHTAGSYNNNHWGFYSNSLSAASLVMSWGPPGGVGTGGPDQGTYVLNASGSAIAPHADDDILSWAFDVDAGKAWIGVNGVWYNGTGPAADSDPLTTGITSSDVTDLRFRWGNHAASSGGVGKILTEAESSYFNGGALF